ncbi:hypothetical protein Tco_0481861 [Tanacetum coccineum]
MLTTSSTSIDISSTLLLFTILVLFSIASSSPTSSSTNGDNLVGGGLSSNVTLMKEAEAAEAIRLRAEASKFEVVEGSLLDEAQVLKERNTTLEKEKSELEIKVADLAASVKLIFSALQRLQSVNLSLIAKLRSNKDARVETIMNLLRLDDTLAEKLGLTESQPHFNQLMVPIHPFTTRTNTLWCYCLSLPLERFPWPVFQKIRENIANHISALRDVFIPLAEPFSAVALEGTGGTSEIVPATVDTTTALSTTLASVSTIIPISVDDYDVAGTDDQAA